MDNMDEQLAELGKRISEAASQWRGALELLRKTFKEVITPFAEQFGTFLKLTGPIFAEFFIYIHAYIKEWPERNWDVLRTLAQHGWYLDPEMVFTAGKEFADFFTNGKVEEANEQLCDYFDAHCDEIEASLTVQFPTRARLLHSAFEAHRRGQFALSIPVFLAQADGICQEITGAQLYSQRDGLPKVASTPALATVDSFTRVLLTPIVESMPISASQTERGALGRPVFNRHAVLHGESVDYDSRPNGCRAISFLVFVAWVLRST